MRRPELRVAMQRARRQLVRALSAYLHERTGTAEAEGEREAERIEASTGLGPVLSCVEHAFGLCLHTKCLAGLLVLSGCGVRLRAGRAACCRNGSWSR